MHWMNNFRYKHFSLNKVSIARIRFFLIALFMGLVPAAQNLPAQESSSVRTISVLTKPNAIVWIDNVKRGITNASGRLAIKPVLSSAKTLRVRAFGFKEVSKRLPSNFQGSINIVLVRTSDPAELAFQEAEKLISEDKAKAIRLYKKAVRLKPEYAKAYIGLARILTGSDNAEALSAVAKARKIRSDYPEASVIEGRIYRSENEIDKAVDSFDRAIREGNGFQPEAYTGLGLIFKEDAENANASSDYGEGKSSYEEAIKSFEKAIDQFSATETVVYMFLGEVYEKMRERQKAIAVYDRFLHDFPVNNERSVVESFIEQLKKEIAADQ